MFGFNPVTSAISTFLAPIHFTQSKGCPYQAMEFVGGLFWWGKKRIEILPNSREGVLVQPNAQPLNSSILEKALKVGCCALIVYFAPITAPTVLLAAKMIFRRWCRFKISDPEQELGKGITLKRETITKIQRFWIRIENVKKGKGFQFYSSNAGNRVFTVDCQPGVIFKVNISSNNSINKRFINTKNAKAVCLAHKLHLLRIPSTRLFKISCPKRDKGNLNVIVEELLPVRVPDQTEIYQNQNNVKSLAEAVRQASVFICETGWSDVKPDNLPTLDGSEAQDKDGNQRLALVDLEHVQDSPYAGLLGLVTTVQPELAPIIKHAAQRYGWDLAAEGDYQGILDRRQKQVHAIQAIKDSYQARGITSGTEPIKIDPTELNLTDLADIEVANELEKYLNLQLEGNKEKGRTPLGLRKVRVQLNKSYEEEGAGGTFPSRFRSPVAKILQAMMDKGLIYHNPISRIWTTQTTFSEVFYREDGCIILI